MGIKRPANMKEVLTKKFWQDVKKTFDDAREGRPESEADAQLPSKPESDRAATDAAVPSRSDASEKSTT